MDLLTILLFFIYSYGLGYSLTFFIKNNENFLERNIMRIGIGLGAFITLTTIFDVVGIILDWKLILLLSLIIPVYELIRKIIKKEIKFNPKFTKTDLYVLFAIFIFLFCCFMYIGGAFKYDYLEDDDPWEHAYSVKYISMEKTAFDSQNRDFSYIDPYPPGYDLLMGILHQTSSSINWTLKFFNGLIISLGILFFYFFAKEFTGQKNLAIIATFFLAAIPSYFTHFIWAHSLVIMFFFPAMYCLLMIKYDKKWVWVSAIVISAILLTQPTKAIKIGIMLGIFWLVKSVLEKNINKDILIAEISGLLISLVWWGFKWQGMFLPRMDQKIAQSSASIFQKIISAFPPDTGSATRAYTFSDFFIAQPFGGINVQFGWGIAISILVLIGTIIIFINIKETIKKENSWILVTFIWFIFTFLGTNSMTFNLPIGLFAFRFWLLLAIPVALIAAYAVIELSKYSKKIGVPGIAIIIIALFAVYATAGSQKFNQNYNTQWPPGVGFSSMEEVQGYNWLNTLPDNTKVYGMCSDTSTAHILGYDKFECGWCNEEFNFKKNIMNETPTRINSFLKKLNYEYLVLDTTCVKNYGINETNRKYQEISGSGMFKPAHANNGIIILRVI